MNIDIQNMDSIIARLEHLTDDGKMLSAMGKACSLVERRAKQLAPKDTGQLRNSITSKVERDGNDVVGVVFTPKEYAPYVEYGTGLFAENGGRKDGWAYEDEKTGEKIWTRGQRPHPYLRPALNENREKILKILEESVKND